MPASASDAFQPGHSLRHASSSAASAATSGSAAADAAAAVDTEEKEALALVEGVTRPAAAERKR